ncbi:MAG: hypothetical protein MJA30_03290 [Cytophagales bacterium]|nr:hypothetical protein [Cytophagales bacterium]
MKSSVDDFPAKQSKIYPSIQKETSTGGTATFVDNRSSTVYQRQLQKAMDAHVATKALPLQRKAATGSSRFQQVAADMGRKYGVDTSGLKATHQSPFPAKLNAEATIQGNNIHFAPGKDTDYNIRHEVAHAIDNRLNGTPKGDQLVNGQKIDTTREKVVDRMVKASTGISFNGVNSLRRVYQLETKKRSPVQLLKNDADTKTENAIDKIILWSGKPGDSSKKKAKRLLQSPRKIFWYGKDPKTDEQTEIMGSANYLRKRKIDWKNKFGPGLAWQRFQKKIEEQSIEKEMGQLPWFLAKYKAGDTFSKKVLGYANNQVKNPSKDDPQQIFGSTYSRDISFGTDSDFAIKDYLGSKKKGRIIQVMDQDYGKVLEVREGDELYIGTVIRSHGLGIKKGTTVRLSGTSEKDTTRISYWQGDEKKHLFFPYQSLDYIDPDYYNYITRAGYASGAFFDRLRNRGEGPKMDANLISELEERKRQSGPNLKNSLGPYRNLLNIEDLNWGIKVATYRRLGGDLLFNEAPQSRRDREKYHSYLPAVDEVNVTDSFWYYELQRHMSDRFVGGRSNSTLGYLQSASLLYMIGEITLADARDVMAFVIADMVVSGEHSMPECMMTVVRVADKVEPWKSTKLHLQTKQLVLHTWLHLVDGSTRRDMEQETNRSLVSVLDNKEWDYQLVKILVVLGKQMYNYNN